MKKCGLTLFQQARLLESELSKVYGKIARETPELRHGGMADMFSEFEQESDNRRLFLRQIEIDYTAGLKGEVVPYG